MNENNLVRRLSYLTPGDGFRKCAPIDVLSQLKDATGQILSGGTSPPLAALETGIYGVQPAASTTFCGQFLWVVPQDYDASADELRIMVACDMAGTTNQALSRLTAVIYRKRMVPAYIPDGQTSFPAGLAVSADLGPTPTAVGAIPLVGTHLATKWVEINADFNLPAPTAAQIAAGTKNRSLAATADASIKPGDILDIVLNSAAHTTDVIHLYGIELWYRSNLAFSEINSR
jgi:hypothetical protein